MASVASKNDTPEQSRYFISGHQIEIGEALHSHTRDRLEKLAATYFCRAADATAIFKRDGKASAVCCTIRFRVAGGVDFSGRGRSYVSAYAAFAEAEEHVAKQLRRRKRAMREDKAVNVTKADVFRLHDERIKEEREDMPPMLPANDWSRSSPPLAAE